MATVRFQEWLQQSTAEAQEWTVRWPSSEACDTLNPKTGLPYFSLSIPRCTSRSAVIRLALEGKRTLLNVPLDFDDFDRLLEEAVASYIIAQRPAQKRDVEYWRREFGKVYYWKSHPIINNRENGNNRRRNIINVADGPGSFPALEEWEQASSLTVSHMLLALLFCYNRFPIGIPLCALPSCATMVVMFAFTPLAPELRRTISGWDGDFGAFAPPPPSLPPRLPAAEREKARKGQQTRRGGRELNAIVVIPDKQKQKRRRQHHADPLKNVSRNLIPVDSYEGFVCITEDEKSVEF